MCFLDRCMLLLFVGGFVVVKSRGPRFHFVEAVVLRTCRVSIL